MTQSSNLGATPTGTGATVRSGFNTGFQALASDNEGSSAPSPTYPFMPWRNASAAQLKRRNGLNSGWEITETYGASTDPGPGDDATVGYIRGSRWINAATNKLFWCLDPSAGAARWLQLGAPAVSASQVLSVAASNTTTPQTLASIVIPANTFAKDGDNIDFEILGTHLNNQGVSLNVIMSIGIAGTDLIRDTAGIATDTDTRFYRLYGRLWRAGASAAGCWMSYAMFKAFSTATAGRGDFNQNSVVGERSMISPAGGVAVDWTAANTISWTWQMLTASAQCSMSAEFLKTSFQG